MKHVVTFVLDRSGSMDLRREETISGFNAWMEDMEKFAGEVLFTFLQFDSVSTDVIRRNKLLSPQEPYRLSKENFVPRAYTPLWDAVGKAIRQTEEAIQELDGEEVSVLLVVMTDGQENDSKEWTLEPLRKLIESKTNAGWTVTYLGASVDAWDGASLMGISRGNTLLYDGSGQSQSIAMSQHAGATRQHMTKVAQTGIANQPVLDFYMGEEDTDGEEVENTGKIS
jgi:hypothetical protein